MDRREVYQLTFPNDKSYIGVSKHPLQRLKYHRHNQSHVGNAIRKYGDPKVKILLVGEASYCYEMERRLIKNFRTLHPEGYNLAAGGIGVSQPSNVVREKMADARRGKKHSPETIEKIRKAGLRENLSPETRRLRSEANRRRKGEKRPAQSVAMKLYHERRRNG